MGAGLVGGDLTSADQVVISVTVLGGCTVSPVLRSGARPGDVVALAGRQGWAAGGLAVLGRGFRSRGSWSTRIAGRSRRTTPGRPPPTRAPPR